MSTDPWQAFQVGSTAERLELVRDPANTERLTEHLGPAAMQGYQQLAARLPSGGAHLGADQVPNLVFVPGVMGSVLASSGLGGVWWIDVRTRNRLDRLGLSDDGAADAAAGARVTAVAVDASYDSFCTAALAQPDFGHRTYPYDWRKPISAVTDGLRTTIRDAYRDNGNRPVHLVGHSMGGLVIREALRGDPSLWAQVGRIAFLGTPHYGSTAIAGYLKNHLWGFELLALLGRYLTRPTLRSMWGVLSLLPAPAGVYPGSTAGEVQSHPCANFDLYDAAAYRLKLDEPEQARLQRVLDGARQFHIELAGWHHRLAQEQRDRMLVVAGVGFKTLFRLAYKPVAGFLWEHMDRATGRRPGDPNRDGDGRVPLASAQLEYVGSTRYVRGEHGGLPAIPAVQSAVFDWLRHQRLDLAETPAAALAATLSGDTGVELPELGSVRGPASTADDPGYLRLDQPDEATLHIREQEVDAGRVPEFTRLKLL